ncbi:hypothetical protein GOD54_23565 [Sinorhizobium medicae]|nr:hypothetical protein [Sinorhizobium medicae]
MIISSTLGARKIAVDTDAVVYFQAKDKYVQAAMLCGRELVLDAGTTIKKLVAELPDSFLQISSSVVVARRFITGYSRNREGDHGGYIGLSRAPYSLRVTKAHVRRVKSLTSPELSK